MWAFAITFLIICALRYAFRLYQQRAVTVTETETVETSNKSKASSETSDGDGTGIDTGLTEQVKATKCQPSEAAAEDYDEYSTGHNVTKILTGPGSRNFHLSQEQIEQGKKVNKELLERMAKRKIHAE